MTDIVWVEVRNEDLGPSIDPHAFLKARVAESGDANALAFLGLHTAVGESIGGAVYDATRKGAERWDRDFSEQ